MTTTFDITGPLLREAQALPTIAGTTTESIVERALLGSGSEQHLTEPSICGRSGRPGRLSGRVRLVPFSQRGVWRSTT